ncbi:MAG: beta-propeller domain-containing protein [Porphyrobacter sp.]|nr:beta-propeller domain-containing protein [Porphyrobacter sp.]
MQEPEQRASPARSIATLLAIALAIMAAVGLTAPATRQAEAPAGSQLRGFADKREFAAFTRQMAALERRQLALFESESPTLYSISIDAAASPEEAPAEESITNTQEAGVDEGGIVKRAGDWLVVLRRGRLFTIRVGGDALAPAAAVDAFAPDKRDPDETWYDELLVHDRQIIVIGYSYGQFGTELNRFDLGDDGSLTWRDTHYLRSGDYYSSSNYASRLIGDELVLYAPVYTYWTELDAMLPAMRERDPKARPRLLVQPEDILVAEPYRSGRYPLGTLHTITRCDLSRPDLECRATAIAGTANHAFYVSRKAVYALTEVAEGLSSTLAERVPGQLYRIPLDGSAPGAVQVAGAPVDQFSFAEDAGAGVLRVLLRSQARGDGMWASEVSDGDVALATIPFASFAAGAARLPEAQYRDLPEPAGYVFQNRFLGDYVLYGATGIGDRTSRAVYAVPLDGRAVQKLTLTHEAARFDRIGDDAVVVGRAGQDALGFTALSLGQKVTVEDIYRLAGAQESEARSQAFFYRPDPASADGSSGILGLPITRWFSRSDGQGADPGAAILFLRREQGRFAGLGELAATRGPEPDDRCKASCTDWYGNARPIFLGNRVLALMGYELVEGSLAAGALRERRRTSFAP